MSVSTQQSLRSLAAKRGLYIGTCANYQHLENDPAYAEIISREFNSITSENELKFRLLCPAKGEYNFEPADKLVAFAARHNMHFRGHVLIWDEQLPNWLVKGGYSRTELIEILTGHIETVVSRYGDSIHIWDVVNEAVDHNGELKKTFWYNGIGPDFIEIAFHAAAKANPTAKLFYNDQGCEGTPEHHDGVYKLMKNLKQKQVPVDGVGFQMHLSLENFDKQLMHYINLERLQDIGLEFNITELDVRMQLNPQLQTEQLNNQAQVYADIFNHFVLEKGCTAFSLWGFTDRYSWIPFFYPAEGNATIMSEDYTPKPAHWSLMKELETFTQSNLSWQTQLSSAQSPGRVLK